MSGVASTIEAFSAPPGCVFYCDPDFAMLKKAVKDPRAFFHSEFLYACAAMTMNLIFEKGWSNGSIVHRPDRTAADMCQAQRYVLEMA